MELAKTNSYESSGNGSESVAAPNSLGLRGLWALVGNSSAVVVLAVVMFIALYQVQRMHTEGMAIVQQLHIQEREFNRQQNEFTNRVIEKNTMAIEALATEIRWLRQNKLRE